MCEHSLIDLIKNVVKYVIIDYTINVIISKYANIIPELSASCVFYMLKIGQAWHRVTVILS